MNQAESDFLTEVAPTSLGRVDASLIPVLETDRLRLRAPTVNDLDAVATMWADPAVVEHIGGQPRDRAHVWTTLQRNVGSWALLGYGYWIIESKASGQHCGEVGFLEGLRDLTPGHIGMPEAGWGLPKHAWGQGIATEALTRVLQWADAHLAAPETACIIGAAHTASIHVAKKCGYACIADTTFAETPTQIFRRPRGVPPM